ncbi:hypothetical protein Tco_1413413, partial [Tanacetum coccineum]
VAREPSWRQLSLGVGPNSIHFPTFLGRDLYALRDEGELIGFRVLGKEDNSWTLVKAKAPVSLENVLRYSNWMILNKNG